MFLPQEVNKMNPNIDEYQNILKMYNLVQQMNTLNNLNNLNQINNPISNLNINTPLVNFVNNLVVTFTRRLELKLLFR